MPCIAVRGFRVRIDRVTTDGTDGADGGGHVSRAHTDLISATTRAMSSGVYPSEFLSDAHVGSMVIKWVTASDFL